MPTSEPITIQQASKGESTVSVVASVLSVAPDQIVKRDGSGVYRCGEGESGGPDQQHWDFFHGKHSR